MARTPAWDPPSPRVAELIRTGASLMMESPEAAFEAVDQATFEAAEAGPAIDPQLAAAIRRTNRANMLTWATANVNDPGAPVAPNLGPDTLAIARDAVRRGYDQGILQGYRTGQNTAWEVWMQLAFELTDDPHELREFLEVSARSIFAFVDATLEGIAAQIDRERDELTRGTHAQRLETVSLLLEGAPISTTRASQRLGYELDRRHTAAIVWADESDTDPLLLEQAAEAFGQAAGARPLTVVASVAALWVWVAGKEPDLDVLRDQIAADEAGVHVAVGTTSQGVAGFRRSHLDAIDTQRLMLRSPTPLRIATYDDVAVAALATENEERARQFVDRTLGAFAHAPAELHETARVYLREGSNVTRTAKLLFAHRNTVLGRLARIKEMLPVPLDDHRLQVALALEVVHWTGAPSRETPGS